MHGFIRHEGLKHYCGLLVKTAEASCCTQATRGVAQPSSSGPAKQTQSDEAGGPA